LEAVSFQILWPFRTIFYGLLTTILISQLTAKQIMSKWEKMILCNT
jgi:ABC-type iron transport system FetAB permease component